MAIKMTMADGTVIEGTAEELAKLQELAGITEESEEPTKEFDKPAQVGDTILITDARGTSGLYDDGDKLTVRKIDDDNDVVGVEEFEDFKYITNDEFNIIGRKNHKDFAVGDKVKLTIPEGETPEHAWGSVHNGDVGTVVEIDGDGDVRVDFTAQSYWRALPSELTLVEDESESLVGKFVVFHDRKGAATVGKHYEITGILEHGGGIYAEYTIEDGEEGSVAYPPSESAYDYEIFDEKPADEPSFVLGDFAKVIGNTYHNDIKVGTFVKITKNADYAGDYEITLLDGSDYDYVKPEAVEKVSESDIVFIENGREPGEYKKGDIVGGSLWNDSNDTFFGVVVDVSDTMVGVRVPNGRYYGAYKKDVKPYAFVEKRADKID